MALSANTKRVYAEPGINSLPVKATEVIYEGSAVGLTAGYARPLTAGDIFGGFALEAVTGTAADGGARVQAQTQGLIQLAISSLAVTDVGKPVYASDDGTFTLTQSTNSPIGRVHRWVSTGIGIIAFDADYAARGTGIAALTFGTNIAAATANGALVDSSATNPTDAQFNELAKELGTKINEIIAALK